MPQFATAEFSHIPGSERCRICGGAISGEYFRINNQMACGKCAGEARDGQPKDSHAAFARGLMLGIGAAILGMILYATFTIVTGFYVGYIALGVGWLVATAMMKGSNRMGGRRYQVTAVLLTYAAISMAAIPIGISYYFKHNKAADKQQQTATTQDSASTDDSGASPEQSPKEKPNLGALAVQLVMMGLASPFLELQDPVHGAIGLFILFIGLRIAWQVTAAKPLAVDGPYPVTA